MTETAIKTTIRTVVTHTLTDDQAADIIRAHFGADKEAHVDFDCGCDYLRKVQVQITKTEVQDS